MIVSSLFSYVLVAMLLFSIGLLGVIARKNIFVIYMSIELMFNAINLLFVALAQYRHSYDGQIFAVVIIATAAAEAAVFLALIVVLFRRKQSLDADAFRALSQKEAA